MASPSDDPPISPVRQGWADNMDRRLMQLITPHLRPGLGYIEEFWAPLAKVDSDYNKAYWDFLYGRIEQPEFAKRGKQLQDAWMQQIERLKKGAYDPAIGRALQNRASHSPDEE